MLAWLAYLAAGLLMAGVGYCFVRLFVFLKLQDIERRNKRDALTELKLNKEKGCD
jgi:hypothetical protein